MQIEDFKPFLNLVAEIHKNRAELTTGDIGEILLKVAKEAIDQSRAEWEKENPVTVAVAVNILQKALLEDKEYRRTWQANIAMAFHDELTIFIEKHGADEVKGAAHMICNVGADRFLTLLTSTVKK